MAYYLTKIRIVKKYILVQLHSFKLFIGKNCQRMIFIQNEYCTFLEIVKINKSSLRRL